MTDNLRCKHCDKEFRYESEKKRHELSHSPRFQCDICIKKFSFISALKRHKKQHLRQGNVNCKQCSRSFRDETLLQRHIKYAHKGKHMCKKCNAEFHSELALSTHMKIHNAKSERRYHCRYNGCEKTFNFPHHLKHHEMTHTNAKQHHCYICEKGFIQSHHLKSHMKTHEPEKWLHCTEINCKKTFPTDYSRKRHLLHVHNVKLDNNNILSGKFAHYNTDIECIPNDTILCKDCDEIVDMVLLKDHQTKCSLEVQRLNENNNEKGLFDKKSTDPNKELSQANNVNDNRDMNDCKTALGSCIMNDYTSETCLCAQIKTSVDDYYDNVLDVDENINLTKDQTDLSINGIFNKPTNQSVNAGCKSCECKNNLQFTHFKTNDVLRNSTCNVADGHCLYQSNVNNDLPAIEYKIDGSIKLKDTFDIDINIFKGNSLEKKMEKSEDIQKSCNVSFKSCEAALGKCIVSGNGTISDDCLCAKMLVDEQLMTEEEIDEITPHPAFS